MSMKIQRESECLYYIYKQNVNEKPVGSIQESHKGWHWERKDTGKKSTSYPDFGDAFLALEDDLGDTLTFIKAK